MEPNFQALQVIAEVALGIVGFSAILIGLSRASDGFSSPDNFRIQLLTYSAFIRIQTLNYHGQLQTGYSVSYLY